jgi:hypothetical protein
MTNNFLYNELKNIVNKSIVGLTSYSLSMKAEEYLELASKEEDEGNKTNYSEMAKNFAYGAAELKKLWENHDEYPYSTILDSSIKKLLKNKDEDLRDELYLTINKAECTFALLDSADKVINAVNNTISEEYIASKTVGNLVSSKLLYKHTKKQSLMCSEGFQSKTKLDYLINELATDKKNELYEYLIQAKIMSDELELAGISINQITELFEQSNI